MYGQSMATNAQAADPRFAIVRLDGPDYGWIIALSDDIAALDREIEDQHTSPNGYPDGQVMSTKRDIEAICAGPLSTGDRVEILAA